MFDPEKIDLLVAVGDEGYDDAGGGCAFEDNQHESWMRVVRASDYDQLLHLYRELRKQGTFDEGVEAVAAWFEDDGAWKNVAARIRQFKRTPPQGETK